MPRASISTSSDKSFCSHCREKASKSANSSCSSLGSVFISLSLSSTSCRSTRSLQKSCRWLQRAVQAVNTSVKHLYVCLSKDNRSMRLTNECQSMSFTWQQSEYMSKARSTEYFGQQLITWKGARGRGTKVCQFYDYSHLNSSTVYKASITVLISSKRAQYFFNANRCVFIDLSSTKITSS